MTSVTHVPRGAARTLARGWASDSRRWTWATTAVLASTLVVLLGTSGVIEGTAQRTLRQVSDFYAGDLRVTPSRPGALPADWFPDGAAGELRAAGATVSGRVEAQYVLSRRGFVDAYLNEQEGVPVGVPGSDADPEKQVTIGALVGIDPADPGAAAIARHLVDGRMPRSGGGPGTPMELLMSRSRATAFLADAEEKVPGSLLQRVGVFSFDITSAMLDPSSKERSVLHRDARVVGLYETGVDMLDSFTLVAAAPDVRYLLAQPSEGAVNVLVVQDGAGAARGVAAGKGWAMEGTRSFADRFVGQLIGVLQAVAWLVSALLFLLPTALIGHGLARQLSAQRRELAVATAIGVPRRTLADALSLQVFQMAGWACALAAVAALLLALVLTWAAPSIPSPLPLGFAITWASILVAVAVTALSVAVGLWVGMRSRAALPLAASLRAA